MPYRAAVLVRSAAACRLGSTDAMRSREEQLKAMKGDRRSGVAPLKVRGDVTAIMAADFFSPFAVSANENRAKTLAAVEWAVPHPVTTSTVSLLPASRAKPLLSA